MLTTKIAVLLLAVALFVVAGLTAQLVATLEKQNELLREQNMIYREGLRCRKPIEDERFFRQKDI